MLQSAASLGSTRVEKVWAYVVLFLHWDYKGRVLGLA